MGGFLSRLGQKAVDRWFNDLVLPGLLFLALATTACALGQAHALEPRRLGARVTAWAKGPAVGTLSGQVTLLVAVLVAAAAAALTARAVGRATETAVLGSDWRGWPRPMRWLAGRLVERRQRKWVEAEAECERARQQVRRDAAHRQSGGLRGEPLSSEEQGHREWRDRAAAGKLRVAEVPPERPTWSGDRIAGMTRRLHDEWGIDLARVWPALWLTLPEPVCKRITEARTALTDAATLAGWSVLCLPLTAWWWPALIVTAVLMAASRSRFRDAADTYGLLLHAAACLHTPALQQLIEEPASSATLPGTTLSRLLGPHQLRRTSPHGSADLPEVTTRIAPARSPADSPPE